MGLNLHRIVSGAIGSVNPPLCISVQVSTGSATNADGTRTPTYAAPVSVLAQVQPLTWRDIQMMDGLNLQGTRRAFYLNGEVDGLVRPTNQGGDLVTLPDGSVWLVALVAEGWNATAGWCKILATLQNDAPFNGQS